MDNKTLDDRRFLKAMHIQPESCSFCDRDREIISRQAVRIQEAEKAMEEEHSQASYYKGIAAGWMALSCLLAAAVLLLIAQAMGKLSPQ